VWVLSSLLQAKSLYYYLIVINSFITFFTQWIIDDKSDSKGIFKETENKLQIFNPFSFFFFNPNFVYVKTKSWLKTISFHNGNKV